jgi:beta-lactamase regulating signal transducer with metallopeptidase domain/biotin carboxyl carrier protein
MKLMVINGLAEAWLEALERAGCQGGLALALVWVVCRLFPRISPRAQSWLWRLAYLKLVTAFLLPASIDVPLLPAPVLVTTHRNVPASALPQVVAPGQVFARPVAAPPRLSLAGGLLLGWTVGVGAYLARMLRGWRLTRALRRTCRPVDDQLLKECCAETGHRLGLRQTPPIAVTQAVPQPLLLGPLRPLIVLPSSLLGHSNPVRLRMILAHELAHYQRLDLWWGWMLVLGESLFFFHPLVWLSRAEWRFSQEMACDALAVRAAKSTLTDYGTMLLDISTSSNGAFAPPRSISVSIVETKRNLERRIKAMRCIGQKPSRRIWVATACLVGSAALGVLPWRVVGQMPASGVDAQEPQKSIQARADRPGGTRTEPKESEGQFLRVFVLKYADAEEVANHLLSLNRGRMDPKASKKVTVVTDRRRNAIIVEAKQDEKMGFAELISVLDQPSIEQPRTDLGTTGGAAQSLTGPPASPNPSGVFPTSPTTELESEAEARVSSRPIPIMPARPGFVQKILVMSGKTVRKGDPLVELDNREATGKLNYALAQLDVAKAALAIQEAQAKGVRREYERFRELAAHNAISSDELETKKTAYEVEQARIAKVQAELRLAQEQVEQNKIDVSLLAIRAPDDGTVMRIHVQVGEYVSGTPAQPLMVISR